MNSTPKISIILPVFNAKKHIEKCIDTLLNQTLQEIEIIVILDCPTDRTEQIILKYAEKDKRIRVIENTKNLHIGESRNVGIREARGEYIGFSDHDDFRDLTMYETLYNTAITNLSDIVFSPCKHISFDEGIVVQHNKPFNFSNCGDLQSYCLKDLIGNGNNERNESLFINIQGCIYRNKWIKQHNFSFVDTRAITPEDVLFQIDTFSKANKIKIVNDAFYYHVSHSSNEGSKSSYKDIQKRCLGLTYIFNNINDNSLKESFYINVQKQFLNFLAQTLVPFPNVFKFCYYRRTLREIPFCAPAFEKKRLIYNKKGIKRLLRNFLYFSLQ